MDWITAALIAEVIFTALAQDGPPRRLGCPGARDMELDKKCGLF
jgi:hypothetical protein